MTIKQNGGIFGRNPEFNDVSAKDVSVTDEITILENGVDVGGVRSLSGQAQLSGTTTGITFGTQSVVPTNGGSAIQNGTRDIGNGSNFWRNVYVSTGVYFGSQTTATHLDDYEEGNWTPTGNGVTFASASGTYTKVGRVVHVIGQVAWPTTSNGSQANINGLPFTASSQGTGHIGLNNIGGAEYYFLTFSGGTAIRLYNSSIGSVANSALSGKSLYITATYFV